MKTDDFAVTLVLRIAIITSSLASAFGILVCIWLGFTPHRNTIYGTRTRPNVFVGLGMVFSAVMWSSIVLSFLLYMSWRVRSGSEGAASPAGFYPPGGPSSTANYRRQASST
jgi:hypothetical protein